jgi:NhaP-type Na+/H+ or K+/H+ antiporter
MTLTEVGTTTGEPSDDPLAGLTEEAQHVLLIIGVLLLSLILNNFVEKCRIPIPQAIVTVLVGVVCGGLGHIGAVPLVSRSAFAAYEASSARQFMLLFIAPIIFAEGYGMKSLMFFENLSRILTLAFVGTVLSTVVVALFVYYLPPLTGYTGTLPWLECLTFGSLISAVDPVTTLAIFKDVGLVEQGLGHLYYSVLGESILNDAVALTLFDGFEKFVVEKETALTWNNFGELVGGFFVTFLGSMAIGIVSGMLGALLLKFALLGAKDHGEDHYHFNVPESGTAFAFW